MNTVTMLHQKRKLDRIAQGEGFYLLRYQVTNLDTGVVGVYTLFFRPNGSISDADRSYHYPADRGDYPGNGTLMPDCEFLDGEKCFCNSSFAGVIDGDAGRWLEAEYMSNAY